jgi:hypothetical protein
MNRLLFCFILIFFHLSLFAQRSSIHPFLEHVRQFDAQISLTLEGPMLQAMMGVVEDDEGKKFLEKISKVQVVTFEKAPGHILKNAKELLEQLNKEAFQPVLQMREDGTTVEVWAHASEDLISEAFLMVQTGEETIFISLEGAFSASDLRDMNLPERGRKYLPKGKA